jgi:hypothetical protein
MEVLIMAFDIKKQVEEITKKLQSDPKLLESFQKEPVKTLEGLTGVDLPDDKIQPVVDAVKAKLAVGNIGSVAGKLGGLFNKK